MRRVIANVVVEQRVLVTSWFLHSTEQSPLGSMSELEDTPGII
jgi:hypothetical protein